MYETFKLIHVLAAMAWFGGATYHVFATVQLAGSEPAVMQRWGEVGSASGKKYYMPASIVTLLAGIAMLLTEASPYGFGEAWVSVGFGGIIATIVIGAVLIERTSAMMTEAMSAASPDIPTIQSLAGRLRLLSMIDILVLAIVTWAMVVKPG